MPPSPTITVDINQSSLNAAADEPVLNISELSKSYVRGEVQVDALKGVSVKFYAGKLVVLLGASGSGKSTLINIIGGLDVPSSGKLFFHGREITAATEAELTAYRRRSIGFVFQFYNLISSLTALENVQLVTEIAEHPMSAKEALLLVGLGHRLDHFPAQLSGGHCPRYRQAA